MVNVALTVSSFQDHFLVVYAISLIEARCVHNKKFRYQNLQHIPLTIKEKKLLSKLRSVREFDRAKPERKPFGMLSVVVTIV